MVILVTSLKLTDMKVYNGLEYIFTITPSVQKDQILVWKSNSYTIESVTNDQVQVVRYKGARLRTDNGIVIHRPTLEDFKDLVEKYDIGSLYTDSPQYCTVDGKGVYVIIEKFS